MLPKFIRKRNIHVEAITVARFISSKIRKPFIILNFSEEKIWKLFYIDQWRYFNMQWKYWPVWEDIERFLIQITVTLIVWHIVYIVYKVTTNIISPVTSNSNSLFIFNPQILILTIHFRIFKFDSFLVMTCQKMIPWKCLKMKYLNLKLVWWVGTVTFFSH